MIKVEKLLKGLRLNCPRNYILYLAGIILVLSLLFDLKGVDNSFVAKSSLSFIFFGLYLWLLDNAFYGGVGYIDKSLEIPFGILWLLLIIFGFSMTLDFAFGFDISYFFNSK